MTYSSKIFIKSLEYFNEALAIFNAIRVPGSAMDSQAGLLHCALKLGELAAAVTLVQELWSHLQQGNTGGMEFPILAYQACAMAFERIVIPPQRQAAIELGHALIMDNASRISDENWRKVYLHHIPENEWKFKQLTVKEKSNEKEMQVNDLY